jgi:dCMP deaminase
MMSQYSLFLRKLNKLLLINSLRKGTLMLTVDNIAEWDLYFYNLCRAVAAKSPCLSRQIGAILVKDKSIIATGYNGPPRGIPHCGKARLEKDEVFSFIQGREAVTDNELETQCPRKVFGYPSGKGLDLCTATHAEVNCIINAARMGVSVIGATMYMNCIVSCRECLKVLINSGVSELVISSLEHYDTGSKFLVENTDMKIRIFRRVN